MNSCYKQHRWISVALYQVKEAILKVINKTLWKSSKMGFIWKNRGSEGLNTLWRHQGSTFKGPSCRIYRQQEKPICKIRKRFRSIKAICPLHPGQCHSRIRWPNQAAQQLHKTVLCYRQLNPCWSSWQAQNQNWTLPWLFAVTHHSQ